MSKKLPTFSIICETENLATAGSRKLLNSLESLAHQEVSPLSAEEFLVMITGDVPPEVLEESQARYPWAQFRALPEEVGYYEAKMRGAEMATGEIVVFCDSDCGYLPDWLKCLLGYLAEHPEVNIVRGETSTLIQNSYDLALAFYYAFDRFSGRSAPYQSLSYFYHGVAFRRDFLLDNPVPFHLPTLRRQCSLHLQAIYHVTQEKVWVIPRAKVLHPTLPLHYSGWRFLLQGRDNVLEASFGEVIKNYPENGTLPGLLRRLQEEKFDRSRVKLRHCFRPVPWGRMRAIFKENGRFWILAPGASLFFIWFFLMRSIGTIISYYFPDLVIDAYMRNTGGSRK